MPPAANATGHSTSPVSPAAATPSTVAVGVSMRPRGGGGAAPPPPPPPAPGRGPPAPPPAPAGGLHLSTPPGRGVWLPPTGSARRDVRGAYRVGPAVAELLGRARPRLREVAGPVLERLARTVDATASLVEVIDGFAVTTLVAEPPTDGPRFSYRLGNRDPLDRGAGGVAALAAPPPPPGAAPRPSSPATAGPTRYAPLSARRAKPVRCNDTSSRVVIDRCRPQAVATCAMVSPSGWRLSSTRTASPRSSVCAPSVGSVRGTAVTVVVRSSAAVPQRLSPPRAGEVISADRTRRPRPGRRTRAGLTRLTL